MPGRLRWTLKTAGAPRLPGVRIPVPPPWSRPSGDRAQLQIGPLCQGPPSSPPLARQIPSDAAGVGEGVTQAPIPGRGPSPLEAALVLPPGPPTRACPQERGPVRWGQDLVPCGQGVASSADPFQRVSPRFRCLAGYAVAALGISRRPSSISTRSDVSSRLPPPPQTAPQGCLPLPRCSATSGASLPHHSDLRGWCCSAPGPVITRASAPDCTSAQPSQRFSSASPLSHYHTPAKRRRSKRSHATPPAGLHPLPAGCYPRNGVHR